MRIYTLVRLRSGLLATRVALHGPQGIAAVQVIIDSGAVYTVVHPRFLEKIGSVPQREAAVRTLERTVRVPVFMTDSVSVFGATLDQYPILSYAPAAFTPGVDGVLSIDVLRLLKVRLDFLTGVLTIP